MVTPDYNKDESIMKFKQIMVLNDGETFTDVEGCFIMAVPAEASIEEIEETLDGHTRFDYPPSDDSEGFVVATFGDVYPT